MKFTKLTIAAAVAATMVAGIFFGVQFWRNQGGPPGSTPIRIAEADLELGARLYAEYCAACHGTDLKGAPDWQTPGPDGVLPAPPHDETGHTWHHDDGLLVRYIELGGQALMAERGMSNFMSGMPGFESVLNGTEIRDVLAFIKSQWPDEQRRYQMEITAQSLAAE